MAAPNLIITRRFPAALRLRLQLVLASAWDALVATHREQAAEFVRRIRPRLSLEEALDRYFREVGVPSAMEPAVRAGALLALAPEIERAAEPDEGAAVDAARGWSEQVLGAIRRRVQHAEETALQCRLAACVADEAVAATHVRMALEVAELLRGEVTPDEAIMHYVRTFALPSVGAHLVFQRAMARWAERAGGAAAANAPGPAAAAPAVSHVFERSRRLFRPALGLHAAG